jgi:Peptidase family M23
VGLALLGPAAAVQAAPLAPAGTEVPRLVFPVLGEATWIDDFGDARGQGTHEGNDLMAPRRSLALAAEAGRVQFWTTSARAGCMLYLEGASGTEYLYVHLNNDVTDENDNRGKCVPGTAYADNLESGDKVAAGEPIGFVGDSGDANGISPHLHFEVHPNGGAATNPFPHLKRARRLLFAAARGTTFTAALTGKVVAAAGEDLQVSVEQVRWWPGGRKSRQPGQKLSVAVPETASVEGVATGPGGLAYPTIDLLLRGSTVTVWTAPAKVTLAAQIGAAGALSAARVVLKPSV